MATVQQGTEAGMAWDYPSFQFGPEGFKKSIRGVGLHAVAYALIVPYQEDGWEGTCEPMSGTPKSVFTASINALDESTPDANLITRWGLDVQYSDVPAQNSQKFQAYCVAADGVMGGATWKAIVAAVEAYKGSPSDSTLYDALASGSKPWAYDLINGETCREPDFVLVRSNSYARNTSTYYDWLDVNKIYTTAQINTETNFAPIVGTVPSTYWLKCSAGADYAADGRYEVATRWISGNAQRYPTHRYTYKT